jgi:nucleotide-binding universal stress UspA family protein
MFKTIVLGLDGTEPSNEALLEVKQLAAEQRSRVIVVHVAERIAGRGGGLLHVDENEIQEKIKGQVQELRAAGIDVELKICSAMLETPAHEIANIADAHGADLIATGTRGHTGAAGVLVGSVSHRLVHLAHCPILIVPVRAVAPTAPDVDVAVTAKSAG